MIDLKTVIKDPLLSRKTIDELFDISIEGGEYWQFVNSIKRGKDLTEVDDYYVDQLYSMIFNNARENYLNGSFINLTEKEFSEARDKMLESRIASKDFFHFITVRGYLREIGKLSSKSAIEKALSVSNTYLFEKYFKDIFSYDEVKNILGRIISNDNEWQIIDSRNETGTNKRIKELSEIKHRLYLNLANCDIHRFANYFIVKCQEQKIPYSFKIAKDTSRDDSIILFSDDELLDSYLNVLEQIKNEYPDIVERSYDTPVLCGKINNWIGYGEEPINSFDSYINTRCFPIIFAIKKSYKEWLKEHKDDSIIALPDESGKIITPMEFISLEASKKWLRDNSTEEEFNLDYIVTNTKNIVKEIAEKLFQGQKYNQSSRDMLSYYCQKELDSFIKYIPQLDDEFIPNLVFNIKKSLQNEGVSYDNLCFNESKEKTIENTSSKKNTAFGFMKKRIHRFISK